ncbi:MAG TPA: hypothetical protein VNY27_04275 [Solirubrobacteraceae bacterium]|nr:hypothetical protein [Solirubrobacteraceae bacterium]
MPSPTEIAEQIARESQRRARLGVPAFAGGFLYFLSAIIVTSTLSSAPTVGLLQGLAPALRGEANPAVSPRAVEVKYISHHAFALIAGSTIKSISLVALTLVLLLLCDAARFRRPETWAYARPLVLVGGIGLAVVNVGHQVLGAIEVHNFAVGHDFSNRAVDHILGPVRTPGPESTVGVITRYLDLLAALALTAGMIVVQVNAIRVGLLTRWMGVIGIFSGILIFLPLGGATLEIVPAFWLLGMGMLYLGRWPNGDPPAWTAGEARPWPTQAERRAEREGESANGTRKGKPALASGSDVAPAPAQPASTSGSSRKRRRKR